MLNNVTDPGVLSGFNLFCDYSLIGAMFCLSRNLLTLQSKILEEPDLGRGAVTGDDTWVFQYDLKQN
jgi:hypothetical protein